MTAGRITVIWQPDPPLPGHTAGMVRTATAAIDHDDPMGLLADAIATALGTEFGGPHQDPETRALEALCDVLHERRAAPSTLDDDDADDPGPPLDRPVAEVFDSARFQQGLYRGGT